MHLNGQQKMQQAVLLITNLNTLPKLSKTFVSLLRMNVSGGKSVTELQFKCLPGLNNQATMNKIIVAR